MEVDAADLTWRAIDGDAEIDRIFTPMGVFTVEDGEIQMTNPWTPSPDDAPPEKPDTATPTEPE